MKPSAVRVVHSVAQIECVHQFTGSMLHSIASLLDYFANAVAKVTIYLRRIVEEYSHSKSKNTKLVIMMKTNANSFAPRGSRALEAPLPDDELLLPLLLSLSLPPPPLLLLDSLFAVVVADAAPLASVIDSRAWSSDVCSPLQFP